MDKNHRPSSNFPCGCLLLAEEREAAVSTRRPPLLLYASATCVRRAPAKHVQAENRYQALDAEEKVGGRRGVAGSTGREGQRAHRRQECLFRPSPHAGAITGGQAPSTSAAPRGMCVSGVAAAQRGPAATWGQVLGVAMSGGL